LCVAKQRKIIKSYHLNIDRKTYPIDVLYFDYFINDSYSKNATIFTGVVIYKSSQYYICVIVNRYKIIQYGAKSWYDMWNLLDTEDRSSVLKYRYDNEITVKNMDL